MTQKTIQRMPGEIARRPEAKSIAFTVPAVPVAQPRQRHRIITASGKSFAHNYTPAKDPVNAFKATVRLAVQQVFAGTPLEGPIRMGVVFVFPRQKAKVWKNKPMPRYWHTGKPDRDNLMKSLQDALNGLLFVDDSQICAGPVDKFYAAGDEQPHVEVKIEQLR